MLILDPNGEERYRIEGYLPVEEFRAQLELGLAQRPTNGRVEASTRRRSRNRGSMDPRRSFQSLDAVGVLLFEQFR